MKGKSGAKIMLRSGVRLMVKMSQSKNWTYTIRHYCRELGVKLRRK
jgi:hypothetical protein